MSGICILQMTLMDTLVDIDDFDGVHGGNGDGQRNLEGQML